MTDPLAPNYKRDVGRLATDRFDFQAHVDGTNFKHTSNQINLISPLIIDSVVTTTVQEALQALTTTVTPPVIQDATTITKGIIQIAGDISGIATHIVVSSIQGNPISTLSPSLDDVLTWDGSVWRPSAAVNAFTASGDLSGTNILQSVVGLTGTQFNPTVGFVLRSSNSVINYDLGIAPLITQNTSSTANGAALTIRGQSSTGSNKNGGDVVIAGGATSSGLRGGVKIRLTTSVPGGYPTTSLSGIVSSNMIQLVEVAASRRVLSLCHSSNLSIVDMPSNTGDMVMYVRNAVTTPSTGNPSNGAILYATSGQLWVKQQDGNNFSVGSIPNPSIWGNTGQQTYTSRNYVASSVGAAGVAFSFSLPDKTATKVDVIFVGKQIGSNESGQFNLSMGFVRHSTSATAVGSVTNSDSRTTAGAVSWSVPDITVSGNTLQILTGFSGTDTIQWFVVTQLTMSLSL